jgi:hypothetical protein
MAAPESPARRPVSACRVIIKSSQEPKIGAKVVRHGRYVTFQMAEVAVPQQMFADILSLIARLRAPPAPAWEANRGKRGNG